MLKKSIKMSAGITSVGFIASSIFVFNKELFTKLHQPTKSNTNNILTNSTNNNKNIAHIRNASEMHALEGKDVLNTHVRISNCYDLKCKTSSPNFPYTHTVFFDGATDHNTTTYWFSRSTFPKVQNAYFEHRNQTYSVLANRGATLYIVDFDAVLRSNPLRTKPAHVVSITKQQYDNVLSEYTAEDIKTVLKTNSGAL